MPSFIKELIPTEYHDQLPLSPVMVFSPKSEMYTVIYDLVAGQLPRLEDLLMDHCVNDDPRLPELWHNILPIIVEGRTLIVKLYWYRDQHNVAEGVNCQCFLLGEYNHRFIEIVSEILWQRGIYQKITTYEGKAA